jgi:Ni,Fe-hydrogenase I cytochrome b subunit
VQYENTRKFYKEAYDEKSNYAHKSTRFHVPRYFIIVIWGLFISFVVYVYAIISLNDLDQSNTSIDNAMNAPRYQKVKATIEFLPNEPEPRFVQMPSL